MMSILVCRSTFRGDVTPMFQVGSRKPFPPSGDVMLPAASRKPCTYPSTRREGTGSMGVLCLGGNRVWETHLYGHIGYFT